MARISLQRQLEKSVAKGALVVSDTNKEAYWLPAGTGNQVLAIDPTTGLPTYKSVTGVGVVMTENFSPTAGTTSVTLSQTPIAGTLRVYRNGLRCLDNEFTLSGKVLSFVDTFNASQGAAYSETLVVNYSY